MKMTDNDQPEYSDVQEYHILVIQAAVEEADSDNAEFLEHAEVVKRIMT